MLNASSFAGEQRNAQRVYQAFIKKIKAANVTEEPSESNAAGFWAENAFMISACFPRAGRTGRVQFLANEWTNTTS